MDSPMTNTSSQREARSRSAASTAAYQSSLPVVAMSCQVVPWPGRRGSSTERPDAARYSAQGRIE